MCKKNVASGVAAGVALFLSGPVSAGVLAYWNFNSSGSDLYRWEADAGTGTLLIDPAWTGVGKGTGSDLNAMTGNLAGEALRLKGESNNGRAIDFSVSTVGYENIIFSLATERNNPGFSGNEILYSLDGVNFYMFGPYSPPTAYGRMSFDMSSITALNDTAEVIIRIRFRGATNNGGVNLIDNAMIGGSALPAPGSLGVLAVGSALAGRLRRRRR
jgi:hypothetical protein